MSQPVYIYPVVSGWGDIDADVDVGGGGGVAAGTDDGDGDDDGDSNDGEVSDEADDDCSGWMIVWQAPVTQSYQAPALE